MVDAAQHHLEQIRELSSTYRAGTRSSFTAVRELFQMLLVATVMADGQAVVMHEHKREARLLAGRGLEPLCLRDGRFLRLTVVLRLDQSDDGRRLKVLESSFQYQNSWDEHEPQEIFRYDYLRQPGNDPHPTAHLNIHGHLCVASALSSDRPLSRVHFPTARVSLEAVIRCLADQFGVPCREAPDIWRPMLSEAERAFLPIAHQPLSGPEH